jgi:class II lanthipeptide synthase
MEESRTAGVGKARRCPRKEEWLDQATQLLVRTQSEQPQQHEFDIIYGNAGAIVALLVLHDILKHTLLLDFAVQLGDEVLRTADRSKRGYSWKSFALSTHYNLTGFSHGAAGIASALLELFQKTDDVKYRRAAEATFDYEQHWFDTAQGNWPDFRRNPHETKYNKRSKQPFAFVTFWCHGAPGIALSRLRAYDILNDERYKTEAVIALHATQKAVETALHTGIDNFSLCHGLADNADILLEGYKTLGQEWDNAALVAQKVAIFGINTYAASGKQWPCGISGGSTPGLLLGLAGIGYFYLRMFRPSTPSILLAQREGVVARP